KINTLILALPILGASTIALANTTNERLFTPQTAIVDRAHHHGVELHHNDKAPIAQLQTQPQQLSNVMMRSQAATVSCDLTAL
ncbi:hypothetical protein PJI20_29565, partial [Mycobacterium kansasii]